MAVLDVVIRAGGVTAFVLLSLLLLRVRADWLRASLLIATSLCAAGFVASNTADPTLRLPGAFGATAYLIAGYTVVPLWWLCLSAFEDRFRLTPPLVLVGGAWILLANFDRGLFGQAATRLGLSWLLTGMLVVILGHLGWRLLRDWRGDLVIPRRRGRLFFVGGLIGYLAIDIAADVVLGFEYRATGFAISQNAFHLAVATGLLFVTTRSSVAPIHFAAASLSPTPASPLLARIERLIAEDGVHLDPSLDVARFARLAGASEDSLRAAIVALTGDRHFRAFLNRHRVAHAKGLLSDPARSGDKIASIAFDSGYASLASFNRAFKEMVGEPPSAFRARNRTF